MEYVYLRLAVSVSNARKDKSQDMREQTKGYFGNNVAPLPRIVIDSLIAS